MTKTVNRIIETIMAVLIVCMVGANFWQIFTRFVLNHAADWTEEFMRYALIWLTMLGVPYAYGKNQHIAIEFIVDTFSKKGKKLNAIFVETLILILSVSVFIVGGIMVTLNARGQLSAALQMPMEFYYMGVPVAGFLMVFYTVPRILELVRHIKDESNETERKAA
ncbi:TRAP transporter small permease [Oribacterium sp. WCC10]|uniref:TRAP transporter small permease n=1 Tax=Oribacterium sp. WCC10 TaxID=1855343 RepID=UPI0008F28F03|nr:TRAP transporter small permease [Oribacterium sp. WCC10]SFG45615.1 TRAP-type C4-dicarboxylate transport system, small permease component [Oribacterium sp. WCC10]